MGRIVISEFISLDGVVEDPGWTAPYQHDDIEAYKRSELFAADAMLLGYKTFEMFAAVWPSMTDEQGFAERMNALPKHVVTSREAELGWNATVIDAEDEDAMAASIAAVRSSVGRDLLVGGSVSLVALLIRRGLVDELRLLTYPVVLGHGRRLFPDGLSASCALVETRRFPTGVVLATYRPVS
jgi:dihydrofolate reductase